jgi:hypothetical protein
MSERNKVHKRVDSDGSREMTGMRTKLAGRICEEPTGGQVIVGWEVVVMRRVVVMARMTNGGWERIISSFLFFCCRSVAIAMRLTARTRELASHHDGEWRMIR